jgi:glycyl-tRNA synthetase beta chain
MSDFATDDLLVELGCEELPPKSLNRLAEAFFKGVCNGLESAEICFDLAASYPLHTPRRLAMHIADVVGRQPDRIQERRGPALAAAFDGKGEPTRAALGFAGSVGRKVSELETLKTDKGEWLYCRVEVPGKSLQELIFPILQSALDKLPVARPMRWGDHDFSFVRPVHWLVVLHGNKVLEGALYGQKAGRKTRGHRFHCPGPHEVAAPSCYEAVLEASRVLVSPSKRRDRIRQLAADAGTRLGGNTRITGSLLEEVCNLVEWPVPVTCEFDAAFLEVPQEALIASMEDHQKFFPVLDSDSGRLTSGFVAMSNLESKDTEAVRDGFERVIRPRLADAQFFWDQDRKDSLESSCKALDGIIFHKNLGTVGDKSKRIGQISEKLAEFLDADKTISRRAASLSKCDLVSQMVGEFPELQGTMGAYYARASGEDPAVCSAIEEHYAPRFAGDSLPGTLHGQILALADRLDSLVSIFSIGLQPTGNKDPFALRRAALGVVRILIDKVIEIPLDRLLEVTADSLSGKVDVSPDTLEEVRDFIFDRTRNHLKEQGFSTKLVNSVLAAPLDTLPDLFSRLRALDKFMALPAAESLVAANKRIGNILRKCHETVTGNIDEDILYIAEENALFEEVNRLEKALEPLFNTSEYTPALEELAGLQSSVADFFDNVMVMDENPDIRKNRLALLFRLKSLFDRVADLSMAA